MSYTSEVPQSLKPAAYLAVGLGLISTISCLVAVPLLLGQVDVIKTDLKTEMYLFKQETDMIWADLMEKTSTRQKRQYDGYAAAPPTPAAYSQNPYDAAPSSSSGYGSYAQPPSNPYQQSPTSGYDAPAGPVKVGDRAYGAFQPAAQPPAAKLCSCEDYKCPAGPPGPKGVKGKDGDDGEVGPDGEDGIEAQDAPAQVQQYEKCFHCPAGQSGPQGPPGRAGPRGMRGARGQPGTPGRDGQPGFPGALGSEGPRGSRGEDGPQGLPGEDVEHKVGSPGPRGSPGPIGDAGEPGPRGPDGPIGPQGVTGDPGQPGKPGKDGEEGPSGEAGEEGEPGADATYCPCPSRNAIADAKKADDVPKPTPIKAEPAGQAAKAASYAVRPPAFNGRPRSALNAYRRAKF